MRRGQPLYQAMVYRTGTTIVGIPHFHTRSAKGGPIKGHIEPFSASA